MEAGFFEPPAIEPVRELGDVITHTTMGNQIVQLQHGPLHIPNEDVNPGERLHRLAATAGDDGLMLKPGLPPY